MISIDMCNPPAFATDKIFYAKNYFPYGLARSGEFTIHQAELLEKYGDAYQSLHSGCRQPINEEERQFLKVCRGKKAAETNHEIAWSRFCQKTQQRMLSIGALFTANPVSQDQQEWNDGIDIEE